MSGREEVFSRCPAEFTRQVALAAIAQLEGLSAADMQRAGVFQASDDHSCWMGKEGNKVLNLAGARHRQVHPGCVGPRCPAGSQAPR
eukprot:11168808-Lingulodinium_polyedra.AAC.1